MTLTETLKRLDKSAVAKLESHRAAIRRAYMLALGDIVGIGSFSEKDDLCLDMMDSMIETLAARGGMTNPADNSMPEGFRNAPVTARMPKADDHTADTLINAMSPAPEIPTPFNDPRNAPSMAERRRAGNRTVTMADGSPMGVPVPGEAQE